MSNHCYCYTTLRSFPVSLFCLLLTFQTVGIAQKPLDSKDLKKSSQVPLLHRDRSAQQLYLRILQLEDERSAPNDLISLLDYTHAGVRRKAVLALGRIGDKAATGQLSEAVIDDPNPKVREYAAFALGELEDPKATRALLTTIL